MLPLTNNFRGTCITIQRIIIQLTSAVARGVRVRIIAHCVIRIGIKELIQVSVIRKKLSIL